ncbi:MAG: DsbC family protein [Oceanococcus sp.]
MKKFLVGLLVASSLGSAFAADDQAAQIKALRDTLSNSFPNLKAKDIAATPVDGIYQVSRGASFGYATADGQYFFDGDLIDLAKAESLTEISRKSLRLAALNEIGEDKMIIYPAKNEKHVMTVFTDIDCGYCRKLHREMADYNKEGITVRYMFFPRSGPNTPSFKKAENVWCANNQNAAMDAAKSGKEVDNKVCSSPVMEQFRTGQSLGVRGTPALILDDGSMQPGYVPAARLVQQFASAK